MKGERSKLFKPLLSLGVVVLLLVAGFAQNRLNHDRAALGLTRLQPLKNAPPVLAFTTVALGAFRGLIANALWLRATQLQDQGKYFEMVQLSDWITKLQPHIPTVWANLAWNMAYNISIKFKNPHDRWLWVDSGIKLLRDEAIPYNPKTAILYRELGWIFQHKMGMNLDDAQMYYKDIWAQKMQKLLGGGHPDYQTLLHPKTPQEKARVKRLEDHYKLDPAIMQKVDSIYGPLEWRLPETHALYWAYLGLVKANPKDKMTLRRMIYQSLQLAVRRGRLIENPYTHRFDFAPDPDLIPQANKAYNAMFAQEIKVDPSYRQNIMNAHKNFLKDAVYFLYTYDRIADAAYWFKYLKKNFPGAVPAKQTLDQYAIGQLNEVAGDTSVDKTKLLVEGLLAKSYYNLAMGQDQRAAGYALLAHKTYDHFMQAIKGSEHRLEMPSFDYLKTDVLHRALDPKTGLQPEMAAQLRTKLGLPAPTNSPVKAATNAPPVTAHPQGTAP